MSNPQGSPPPMPEAQARVTIDAMLAAAGWAVQDYKAFNPSAARGIALREVPLESGCSDDDELIKCAKVSFDIFWLKDAALKDSANLPAPEIIVADLEAALEQFSAIEEDLNREF